MDRTVTATGPGRDLEAVLKQYGILGMRWGVRRTNPSGGNIRDLPESSSDSERARAARKKARTSGIDSLSNEELRTMTERINLEQNFKAAQAKVSKKAAVGRFVKDLLVDVGKNELKKAAAQEAAKQIAGLLARR